MTLYSDQWRDQVRHGAQASAATMVPLLISRFHPESMVDVGAGEGWFAQKFTEYGVEATKVDGPWVPDAVQVDFDSPPYPDLGTFDLVLCLEVAEHIAPEHAEAFVTWLCSLGGLCVFSAAIPGQGGKGHVNEQPPAYWVDLFSQHDRRGSGALRRDLWDDPDVEPWYAQNLLVFGDHDLADDGCQFLIHPGIWACYR